jgi:cytochrome P450
MTFFFKLPSIAPRLPSYEHVQTTVRTVAGSVDVLLRLSNDKVSKMAQSLGLNSSNQGCPYLSEAKDWAVNTCGVLKQPALEFVEELLKVQGDEGYHPFKFDSFLHYFNALFVTDKKMAEYIYSAFRNGKLFNGGKEYQVDLARIIKLHNPLTQEEKEHNISKSFAMSTHCKANRVNRYSVPLLHVAKEFIEQNLLSKSSSEGINLTEAVFDYVSEGIFHSVLQVSGADNKTLRRAVSILEQHTTDSIVYKVQAFAPPLINSSYTQEFEWAEAVIDSYVEALLSENCLENGHGLISEMSRAINEDGTQKFSREQLDSMARTLLIIGTGTTRIAIVSFLYMVAKHPEVKKRLQQEMQAIDLSVPSMEDFEKLDEKDKKQISKEIKNKIMNNKYLDCVFNETLRLCPPIPVVSRTTNEAMTIEGVKVPKGTVIYVSNYHMNRDKDWRRDGKGPEDPLIFDPSRFETDEPTPKQFPFGAVHSLCMGRFVATAEIKILAYLLMKDYDLQWPLNEIGEEAPFELQASGGVVLSYDKPVNLRVIRREE